jgi:hypothetical protein
VDVIQYHTDGLVCPNSESRATCLRWHTTTTPVVTSAGNEFYWPEGVKWVDRHGACHTSPRLGDGPRMEIPPGFNTLRPAPVEKGSQQVPTLHDSPRASMLAEASKLITGDRNNQYGPPTQDFDRTAALLNALGYHRTDAEDIVHDIVASDVALIVAQVKMSRIIHSRGKRDSWVDLAGYAACGYECAVEEESNGS